jgi:hypothetical protein
MIHFPRMIHEKGFTLEYTESLGGFLVSSWKPW